MSRNILLTSTAVLGLAAILASSAQAHPPARVVPTKRLKVYYVPGSGSSKQLFVVPSGQLNGSPAQPPQGLTAGSPMQPTTTTEEGREQTPAAVPSTNNPAPTPSVYVVRYTLQPAVKQVNFAD